MADDYKIKIEIDSKALANSLNQSKASLAQFTQNSQNSIKKVDIAWGSFVGNLGAKAVSSALYLAKDAFTSFISTAIQGAANIEKLTTQFTTLTGSAETAGKIMDDLTKFAASTPFELQGLAEASATLLSFGVNADNLIPRLQRIGDVASSSGSDVKEISTIFGQVSAAGKLTTERLLQLQERGIPVLDALAQSSGKTKAEIQEMVRNGKIDFDTFSKAFDSLSEKGGPAFEGMIKQSRTFDGLISTLKDNFNLFASSIGQALLPVLKSLVISLISFTNGLDVNLIRNWVTNGIIVALEYSKSFADQLNNIGQAFLLVWRVGKTSIDALQTGFLTLQTAISGVISGIASGASNLINSLPSVLVPTGWKEGMEEFKNASGAAFDEYKDQLIESASETQATLEEMLNTFKDKVIDDETVEVIKGKIDEITNSVKESSAEVNKSSSDNQKVVKKEVEGKKEQAGFWQSFITKQKKFEEKTNEERVSDIQSTLGSISSLQKSKSKELAFIGKAAAVSTATIDGFLAVQKALSAFPPPFNFVAAGLVGVATAANVANIASTPTGFATGGVISGPTNTGDNILIRANAKERVLTAEQNRAFEQLAFSGQNLNTDILLSINENIKNQRADVNIDGYKLNNRINEINSRRLQ